MLVIRAAQLDTFGKQDFIRFEQRMLSWLETEYPDRFGPTQQPQARDLVRYAMRTGKQQGIETRGGLTGLVGMMADYGQQFERSPDADWACATLSEISLPGDVRIAMLANRFEARIQGRTVVHIRVGETA